jgi:5-methylcytosine-specific restriction endonuclease McrA
LLALRNASPGLAAKYYQQYKASNPTSYKRRFQRSNAKRYGTPRGKLDALIRNAVYRSLAGTRKQSSTYEALGYSLDTLKQHLERQFQGAMSWENYGEWHVDHIVPLAEFEIDGTGSDGFRAAWALGNLRPLWATENIRKRDKRTYLL